MRAWRRLIAIVLLLHVASVHSAEERFAIEVQINGATPAVGEVLVSLFDSQESYLQAPLYEVSTKIDKHGSASISLGKYAPAEYAVVVIYDKNENGKLDTGLFRIPKEKIGYSNNVTSKFGPAKWGDVRFSLEDSDVRQTIQLKKAKE